jgi:hypothetical protein
VVEPMNWADATDETAIEILEWLRDRISHRSCRAPMPASCTSATWWTSTAAGRAPTRDRGPTTPTHGRLRIAHRQNLDLGQANGAQCAPYGFSDPG